MMTFSEAAFYGMGLVLLFGLASLVLAYLAKPKDGAVQSHKHAHQSPARARAQSPKGIAPHV